MKKTMTAVTLSTKRVKGKAMFPSKVGAFSTVGNSARVGKLPTLTAVTLDTKIMTEETI